MFDWIIDWFISLVLWVYNFIFDIIWWILDGLKYMINDPEAFFNEYGLVILLISILIITVIVIINWVTKRYLFHRVYFVPPDKPRNKRYMGRKLAWLGNGNPISGFFYKLKVPEKDWDKFDGLLYFVYPKMMWKIPVGFSSDRVLVPKDGDRITFKLKGGFRWKKDFTVYYVGLKEYHELASKIASNKSKATRNSVGPQFFQKAGKEKLNIADGMAQKGVTANAESQQYQLNLGAVPYNQEYTEMSDRELASVYLEEKKDEEVDPEELSEERVKSVMTELEGGSDDG